MRIVRLILFCIVCFLVGVGISISGMYLPEFVRARNIFFRTVSSEASVSKNPKTENVFSDPLADPVIIEAKKMQTEVIDHLGANYTKLLEGNLDYLTTRDKIRSDYNAGKRDRTTLRSFGYLSALEGDWENYKKFQKEICTDSQFCDQITAKITLSGYIYDEQKKPIKNAKISLFGEDGFVLSDATGKYEFHTNTLGPRKLRFQVSHPDYATGVHTVPLIDPLYAVTKDQSFTKDFTLKRLYQELFIETKKKTITGKGGSVTKEGYQITNPFTKYLIPFDAIRDSNQSPYLGRVRVVVYEFDRATANELLTSDAFTDASGFAAEGLLTYGMPLIFFYDMKGQRLEVYKNYPMQVWTTNRELNALVEANSANEKTPYFNPADYDETQSPEKVALLVEKDQLAGYMESQKDTSQYPITFEWTIKNKSRLPGFWVYDQFSGLWENVGYSLVEKKTDIPYAIHAPFWTKK